MKRFKLRNLVAVCLAVAVVGGALTVFSLATGNTATVTYDHDAKEFIFNRTPYVDQDGHKFPDLFAEFKQMMPGDTATQTITVGADNLGRGTAYIYLRTDAENAGDITKAEQQDYQKLLASKHVQMTVKQGDTVLAEGDLAQGVLLGKFRNDDEVKLDVTLSIDLDAGKNLAGAFYQPSLVVCDSDTLSSLPTAVYLDGCAEVIKYAVLFDPFLFEMLESCGPDFPAQEVISRCVSLKRDVVAEDEFDRGTRQLLNLGHTLGHGIEAGSHFTVSHGQAVAIGMAMVAKAGEQYGITEAGLHRRLCSLLEKFRLPTKSPYDAQCIYTCALSDKKRSGDSVNLIIPERIGHCRIHPIAIRYLPAFIESGL